MKACAVCGRLRPLGRLLTVQGLPEGARVCAGPCWRSATDAAYIVCREYLAHQLEHRWTEGRWRCPRCEVAA